MDQAQLKSTLRKEMNAKRKSMDPEWIGESSKQIFTRWRNRFSLRQVAWLHLFQSIRNGNEIDTGLFMEHLRRRHARIKLVVPIVDPTLGRLRHAYIPEDIEMEVNRWGIPEPKCAVEFVPPMMLDMVLVPLLAFDLKGNRLGYGKGYYDQFLSMVRPNCPKIGLAFEFQKVESGLPAEAHDIPLDYIITEENVYRFNDNFKF